MLRPDVDVRLPTLCVTMMHSSKRAFTLIELLVVIAIIAILAAILFPVFAQAKEAAKKTQDMSNVKNIATGSIMYCADNDDYFPRNDFLLPTRQNWAPLTYREAVGPYIKNGVSQYTWVSTDGTPAPLADTGIWQSPGAPNFRYQYGANQFLMPSSKHWNDWNYSGNPQFRDQNPNGTPTGVAPVPSVSQTQLPRPAGTLMLVNQGIDTSNYASGNVIMQPGVWWWQGASAAIRGATIPPKWDTDSAVHDKYDGNLNDVGPYSSLPRFRYAQSANVAWADGHAKAKKKGALSWCTDMYVRGGHVDPYDTGRWDNSWAFDPGNSCAGYDQG